MSFSVSNENAIGMKTFITRIKAWTMLTSQSRWKSIRGLKALKLQAESCKLLSAAIKSFHPRELFFWAFKSSLRLNSRTMPPALSYSRHIFIFYKLATAWTNTWVAEGKWIRREQGSGSNHKNVLSSATNWIPSAARPAAFFAFIWRYAQRRITQRSVSHPSSGSKCAPSLFYHLVDLHLALFSDLDTQR